MWAIFFVRLNCVASTLEVLYMLKYCHKSITKLLVKFEIHCIARSINRAVNNLVAPDQRTSDAVDVRQQLDLRIGNLTRCINNRYVAQVANEMNLLK